MATDRTCTCTCTRTRTCTCTCTRACPWARSRARSAAARTAARSAARTVSCACRGVRFQFHFTEAEVWDLEVVRVERRLVRRVRFVDFHVPVVFPLGVERFQDVLFIPNHTVLQDTLFRLGPRRRGRVSPASRNGSQLHGFARRRGSVGAGSSASTHPRTEEMPVDQHGSSPHGATRPGPLEGKNNHESSRLCRVRCAAEDSSLCVFSSPCQAHATLGAAAR